MNKNIKPLTRQGNQEQWGTRDHSVSYPVFSVGFLLLTAKIPLIQLSSRGIAVRLIRKKPQTPQNPLAKSPNLYTIPIDEITVSYNKTLKQNFHTRRF